MTKPTNIERVNDIEDFLRSRGPLFEDADFAEVVRRLDLLRAELRGET
jgi:hypothetical protein